MGMIESVKNVYRYDIFHSVRAVNVFNKLRYTAQHIFDRQQRQHQHNMDHDVETTEIHWIESESLFATATATATATDTRTSTNGNTDDNKEVVQEIDEDLCLDDLFIDPDPYETFTLQWKILYTQEDDRIIDRIQDKSSKSQDHIELETNTTTNKSTRSIVEIAAQITVVGNKAENGQILHSTGLTLWRATRSLTDYLVAVHNQHQKSLLQQHQSSQQQPQDSSNALSMSGNTTTIPYLNNSSACKVNNHTISVLELGCGLGIPSMLYHYYLSSSLLWSSTTTATVPATHTITIATDADIDTLQNLRQNLARVQNEQQELVSTTSSTDLAIRNNNTTNKNIITSQQLIWGNSTHIQSVLQTLHSYCNGLGQWCNPPSTTDHNSNTNIGNDESSTTTIDSVTSERKFDILLGSDIIYVEHVVEPLFNTVSQLLSRHGVFLLAFARRNVSIDYVLSVAQQQGFLYEYKELTAVSNMPTSSVNSSSSSMEGVYIFRLRASE